MSFHFTKVKFFLYTHIERMEIELHSFLSSAQGGYKWSASQPRRFTLQKKKKTVPIE
jgi:hypothetical protein